MSDAMSPEGLMPYNETPRVPSFYISSLIKFTSNPDNPDAAIEALGNKVVDDLDTRFSLESTINYLGAKYVNGNPTNEERAGFNNLRKFTTTIDPLDTIEVGKEKVRQAYPQDEIESFLPDTTIEATVKKDHFSPREVASLALLILSLDDNKSEDQYTSVHGSCTKLLELASTAEPDFDRARLQLPQARRKAIELLMEKIPDNEEMTEFIDKNTPDVQLLLIYLDENRELLVGTYLNDLETGPPKIFKKGELIEKVQAVLGENSSEREYLEKHAESIEQRMRGVLTRLIDPETDEYKDTLLKYMDSEKALGDAVAASEKDEFTRLRNNADRSSVELIKASQKIGYKPEPLAPKQPLDLEQKIPGINSTIDEAIKKHIQSGFRTYDIGPILRTFGMKHSEFNRTKDNYIPLPKGPGKDYHPVATAEQAIAIAVVQRNYETFKRGYLDSLMGIIREKLLVAEKNRQSSGK